MNISEWLKDKHDEKKRQRAELRLTQAREEGRREGRQEGRQEGRREVIEWYESKKNDPTNNDPPPWVNLSDNS